MRLARRASGRPRPSISIQSRIAAAAVGAAVGVLCAASAVFLFVQWRENASDFQRNQQALVEVVARDAGSRLADGRDPAGALTLIDPVQFLAKATLVDASGRVIAQRTHEAVAGAKRLAATRAPVMVAGRRVGEVTLLGAPDRLSAILPHYLAICGALFFAATGIALFIGRALALRIVEPVQRLAGVMAGVRTSDHFGVRAPPAAQDEVGRLTDSFNELLARLQANDGALRLTLAELTEARDAAQAANRMKSQFLANMSHEIRTPLNGVLAMTQVIALDELTPTQRSRLNVVHESGQALLAILNDVLDVSKIEAGRLELEIADIDAAAVVRGACEAFTAVTAEKGLRLTVEIAPECEGLRRGDGVRLRQIAVNLVSNAVKFTASGGVKVRMTGLGEGGREGLELEVADTGVGIARDLMPGLFDKFTQGDSSTTRKFGGTGLGLAICQELVGLMDGSISVESDAGKGARFVVRAPLAAAEPSAIARPASASAASTTVPPAPAKPRAGPIRVLAAEDNATNRLVLSTVMQVFGVELHVVDDGAQALAAWEAGTFDAILMDIQMPVLDGVAAARAIRSAEAQTGRARTPIIALSANAMTHQVRDYLAAGMDAHVPKPIEIARLQAVLNDVLDDEARAAA